MKFLSRPMTPASSIRPVSVDKYLAVVQLKERDPRRFIHHVHCATCRGKMLPSLTKEFYCIGCSVAVSNTISVSGPHFVAMMGPGQRVTNTRH